MRNIIGIGLIVNGVCMYVCMHVCKCMHECLHVYVCMYVHACVYWFIIDQIFFHVTRTRVCQKGYSTDFGKPMHPWTNTLW